MVHHCLGVITEGCWKQLKWLVSGSWTLEWWYFEDGKNSICSNNLGIIAILIFIFKYTRKKPQLTNKKTPPTCQKNHQQKKPLRVLSGLFAFLSSHSIPSIDDFIGTTDLYFNSLHLRTESVVVGRLCLNFQKWSYFCAITAPLMEIGCEWI